MAAFVWKTSLVVLIVSMVSLNVVLADDWVCTSCSRLITDFTVELNSTEAQETFERVCVDLTDDTPEASNECHDIGENYFAFIQWLLEHDFDTNTICNFLGACNNLFPDQKQKFEKLRRTNRAFNVKFKKFTYANLSHEKVASLMKTFKAVIALKH